MFACLLNIYNEYTYNTDRHYHNLRLSSICFQYTGILVSRYVYCAVHSNLIEWDTFADSPIAASINELSSIMRLLKYVGLHNFIGIKQPETW